MSRATLAVVCDQLRTLGLEDVARWVEHPEAVRELLSHAPTSYGGERCEVCDTAFMEESHYRTCSVAAAWRALGDPRGAADVERAHEEALREYTRRAATAVFGVQPTTFDQYRAPLLARPELTSDVFMTRGESDAQGMEEVESRARWWNAFLGAAAGGAVAR